MKDRSILPPAVKVSTSESTVYESFYSAGQLMLQMTDFLKL